MTTNNKARIKQLEKTRKAKTAKHEKIIVMRDADGDELATFDGVEMTQAEADKKAAALPDSVLLIRVEYVDYAELQNAGGVA